MKITTIYQKLSKTIEMQKVYDLSRILIADRAVLYIHIFFGEVHS